MKTHGIRDLLLFFAFAGVPIATFLLQDFPNTMFYTVLLVVFLLILVWMRQYHPEPAFTKLLDYDENLDLNGLLIIFMGIVGTYITASLIVSKFALSSLYVPMAQMPMTMGGLQLEGYLNDFLFNITLVAPAEELVKLVLHIALFVKLKSMLSLGVAKMLSVVLPIGTWSMLHAYSAYAGPNMTTLLMSAFIGGVIIFAVLYKTSSLLAAILCHAGYNCVVIYLSYGETETFSLSPYGLLQFIIVGIIIVGGLTVYAKTKKNQ